MGTTQKEITAKLRLDSKEFVGKLDESHKSVLKLTAGMTAISTAVVAAAKLTANYRDETVKAARAAGSTAEDFSALKYAAELSGVSMEALGKGLRKLNDPSREAQAEFKKLGISMRDSSGHMKTQNQMLYSVADAINGLSSPAQKSAAAVAIFGSRAAGMVNLMAGGSEEIKKLTDEATRMGLVFDDKAGAASELFNDNIERLTGSVKGCVQQITGGIIEFVNATGIMETLSGAVQSVTGWWMSLDEETQQTIITIGAVVSGIAALTLGIAAVIAIAPAVGAAVTVMTGGLNLVVLAVAAAIAAFAAVAIGAAKYWDQVKTAIMPAVESIRSAIGSITDVISPIADAFSTIGSKIGSFISSVVDKFSEWFGITDDMSGKISILGTVSKAVFAVIGSAIVIVIGVFRLWVDAITLVGTAIMELGAAFKAAVIDQDFDAAKAALGRIGDAAITLKNDFVGIGEDIKKSFANLVVKIDMKQAKKDLEDLINNKIADKVADDAVYVSKLIGKLAGDLSSYVGKFATGFAKLGSDVISVVGDIAGNLKIFADESLGMGVKVSAVFGMIGKVANSVCESIIDAIVAPIKAAAERMNYYMDILSGVYSNKMDALIERTTAAEDEKIALLNEKYDAQIAALEAAEQRKYNVLEFAANERLLLMDAEYQAAKDKAEEEFALKMEQDAANYELEKEVMLQKSIDKEQAMLVEEVMDADFKAYMENQQAIHDTNLSAMAAEFSTKRKTEEAALKSTLETLETNSKNTITALTEQKNADITAAEEAKNTKLTALEEKKQKDEKNLKKAQILMNWKAEQSEFNSTKQMKMVQTMVTGIAGAASAFAMAAGSIPIVGIILGAVLAAAVLAMTIASVAQIATQQAPSAPAALFLATGGVLQGSSHAQGGISAELEGGEGVLDKARTEKFIEAADNMASGGRGLNVYFEYGSIVNNGKEADESLIDMIANNLARRLERQGVYAV